MQARGVCLHLRTLNVKNECKAYIKPHKLSAGTLTLHGIEGVTGMIVADVRGFGRSRASIVLYLSRVVLP